MCRPLFKLTKRIHVAIPCSPYLPHGAFIEFLTMSWAVERWNLSSMSLLLSLSFEINRREYDNNDTIVPQH
jgi:hypothetical protein